MFHKAHKSKAHFDWIRFLPSECSNRQKRKEVEANHVLRKKTKLSNLNCQKAFFPNRAPHSRKVFRIDTNFRTYCSWFYTAKFHQLLRANIIFRNHMHTTHKIDFVTRRKKDLLRQFFPLEPQLSLPQLNQIIWSIGKRDSPIQG